MKPYRKTTLTSVRNEVAALIYATRVRSVTPRAARKRRSMAAAALDDADIFAEVLGKRLAKEDGEAES